MIVPLSGINLLAQFTDGQPARVVVGQPDFTSSDTGVGPAGLSTGYPAGAFYDGTRLYIADTDNHRVLVYNRLPTVSGASADVVIGAPEFDSTAPSTSATQLRSPRGVFSDGTRLFITEYENHRVLIFNQIPTTNGAAADVVIGQPDFFGSSYDVGL